MPFLLFQGGKAQEAMDFYIDLFDDGEILFIEHYGEAVPGPEDMVYQAVFRVAGQEVRVTDSPIPHAFDFTPSWSFFVDCTSEEEIEELVAALQEGGTTMMPLGEYEWSRKFAWVQDRFGISWQINLP
ncbi:MAG: VOC family protein [Planctomycetota bacterium]